MKTDDAIQFFSRFTEVTSDAVCLLDVNGEVIHRNLPFVQLWERDRNKNPPSSFFDCFEDEAQSSVKAFWGTFIALKEGKDVLRASHRMSNDLSESIEHHVLKERAVEPFIILIQKRVETSYVVNSKRASIDSSPNTLEEYRKLLHDQKRLEESLRESKEQENQTKRLFETIAKSFPNGAINVVDKEYRLIYTNGEEYQRFNINTADFVGKSVYDLFPKEKADKAVHYYKKAFKGERFVFEFENFGQEYEMRGVPLLQTEGSVESILTVVLNITDNKILNREREREKEQLRAITDLVPGAIYRFFLNPKPFMAAAENGDTEAMDASCGFTFMSKAGEAIFGFNTEEPRTIFKSFDTLICGEDKRRIIESIISSSHSLSAFIEEFRIILPSGETRWIRGQSLPSKDSNENIILFNGVFLDVTVQKRRDEAIQASNTLIQAILQSTDDAIIAIDRTMIITHLNDSYRRRYQRLGHELRAGMSMREFISEEYWDGVLSAFNLALQGNFFTREIWQHFRDENKTRYFQNRYTPIRQGDGEIIGVCIFSTDITDRKELEFALRELNTTLERRVEERTRDLVLSQERYAAIAHNFPNGIIGIYDLNFTLLFTDGVEYRKLSLQPESLHGKNLIEIYPPHIYDRLKGLFERAVSGIQSEVTIEFGSEQYSYIITPLFDDEKKVYQIMAVVQNQTDKILSETKLRRSEAMLAEAQSLSHFGSAEFDLHRNEVMWSDELYRIFDIQKEQGPPSMTEFLNYIHPEDRERIRNLNYGAMRNETPYDTEYRVVLKEGVQKVIRSICSIHYGEARSPQKINYVMMDITDKHEASLKLQENEARYRTVLEQTGQLIYDIDFSSGNAQWAGAVKEVVGYEKESYSPSLEEWAKDIYPEDKEKAISLLNETMKTGEPFQLRYRFRHAEGHYFWVEDKGVYLKNESGLPYRILGAMKNISPEVHAEKEKEVIMSKLLASQKLEALGTLASGVAHEFNNLLSIVNLANDQITLLSRDYNIMSQVDVIKKTVERGSSIARQLLDFSRTDTAQMDSLVICDVIHDVAATLKQLLPKKVNVSVTGLEGKHVIIGNEKQLYQVFLNLGINAGDAMPNGGELHFDLQEVYDVVFEHDGNQEKKTGIVVMVTDTGCGMSKDIVNRIFEPFFTTKGIGKGTGLGLSIVHGIIMSHKGFIEVDSMIGQGTTFRIFLPKSISTQEPQQGNEPVNKNKLHGKVLVVDDEPFLRETLGQLLRFSGLEVELAENGEDALKKITDATVPFDIVISDIGMPKLDGVEFYRAMRKVFDTSLIFMTGNIEPERASFFEEMGITILHKPFQTKVLLSAIETVLLRASGKLEFTSNR